MKTRILSDLHLGHSSSLVDEVNSLEPLLEGVDRLILAGDIWQGRTTGDRFDRAREKYDELLNLIDERKIRLVHLRGNHDPQAEYSLEWLLDGKILVQHGDAIFPDATPWSREIGKYRREVEAIIARYAERDHLALACADRAFEIAQTIKPKRMPALPPPLNFFATALWPPHRTIEMVRVWRSLGRQAHEFLRHSGEGARVLICGHFHRPGIWPQDGRLVINTGAFMRGCRPWLVDVEDEQLIVRKISYRHGQWLAGKRIGLWSLDGEVFC